VLGFELGHCELEHIDFCMVHLDAARPKSVEIDTNRRIDEGVALHTVATAVQRVQCYSHATNACMGSADRNEQTRRATPIRKTHLLRRREGAELALESRRQFEKALCA
jgi:hypothetical protein